MTATDAIAAQIKAQREQLGLSQAQAAALAGVSQPYWARAESGRQTSLRQYEALGEAVGLEFRSTLLRQIPGWKLPR